MDNKRHLKKFENQNAYDTQKDELMGIPHVVLFEDTKKLAYESASNDPFNGHKYVDLGLPSGTLWATSVLRNADGEALYFQWGDTDGWTAEQVENGEKAFSSDGSDYKWNDGSSITKYNPTDGKTVLDLEDDAAHVHMGGEWHMPTKEQIEELTANTTLFIATQKGVNGVALYASNGKFIFVPLIGYSIDGSVEYVESVALVWSSSINEVNFCNVELLCLEESGTYIINESRSHGNFVLGVVG